MSRFQERLGWWAVGFCLLNSVILLIILAVVIHAVSNPPADPRYERLLKWTRTYMPEQIRRVVDSPGPNR